MEKKRSNNAEFGLATVFAIFMFVVLWFPPPPSRLSLDKFVLRVCNLVTVKNGRALRLETARRCLILTKWKKSKLFSTFFNNMGKQCPFLQVQTVCTRRQRAWGARKSDGGSNQPNLILNDKRATTTTYPEAESNCGQFE